MSYAPFIKHDDKVTRDAEVEYSLHAPLREVQGSIGTPVFMDFRRVRSYDRSQVY